MAVALQVSGIQPFDNYGDPSSLHQRFEKSFELYVEAPVVVEDKQRRQLFHSASIDLQDISFPLPLNRHCDKLTKYFTPHKNTSYTNTFIQ